MAKAYLSRFLLNSPPQNHRRTWRKRSYKQLFHTHPSRRLQLSSVGSLYYSPRGAVTLLLMQTVIIHSLPRCVPTIAPPLTRRRHLEKVRTVPSARIDRYSFGPSVYCTMFHKLLRSISFSVSTCFVTPGLFNDASNLLPRESSRALANCLFLVFYSTILIHICTWE